MILLHSSFFLYLAPLLSLLYLCHNQVLFTKLPRPCFCDSLLFILICAYSFTYTNQTLTGEREQRQRAPVSWAFGALSLIVLLEGHMQVIGPYHVLVPA